MTHREYPTPLETIAALEARIAKLEQLAAEKSARCTEAVAKMALANAENARLRELLAASDVLLQDWLDCLDRTTDERLKWFDAQIDRSIERETNECRDRIKAELAKGSK